LFAVAVGITVANLYYSQPLLASIATAFRVPAGAAGLLVTLTQVAYATGLVLIVPLGDLRRRHNMCAQLLTGAALALALAATAPSFAVLAIALVVTGLCTVVVQILIPFASTLAHERERGRVVGLIATGGLTGILLARTFSGLVASVAGWRAPFAIASVAMGVLALALWRTLPRVPPRAAMTYPRLLRSVAILIRTEPLLRRRMLYSVTCFAGFSLVWTTLGFLLSRAPFHYGDGVIGLFGLAGLAGAMGARQFGRLHDRGWLQPATGIVLCAVLASWGLLALGAHSAILIATGLVLLDFGAQGQSVLSQAAVFGLGAENASRVATAYITANFAGGTVGSAMGSAVWGIGSWSAVCAIGAAVAAVGLIVWTFEAFRSRTICEGGMPSATKAPSRAGRCPQNLMCRGQVHDARQDGRRL
jgi:predicted MFS family arabinose efflux permease